MPARIAASATDRPSTDTAELVFDDCRVPAANLLGEEQRGFYAIMQNFQNERIAFGAPLWDKQAIRRASPCWRRKWRRAGSWCSMRRRHRGDAGGSGQASLTVRWR